MWESLPDDLVYSIGEFLLHRDARCMQEACIQWKNTWSIGGLIVPHPSVARIQTCTYCHCINLKHIRQFIEPLIHIGDVVHPDLNTILKFMVLSIPINILSVVFDRCNVPCLNRHCRTLSHALVFWCTCERYMVPAPSVCCRGRPSYIDVQIPNDPLQGIQITYTFEWELIIVSVLWVSLVSFITTILILSSGLVFYILEVYK
jgi:hypothetical protein